MWCGSKREVDLVDKNHFDYAIGLDFQATNNVAEYEAPIFRVMMVNKLIVDKITLHNDSQLVFNLYLCTFEAKDSKMGDIYGKTKK